MYGAVGGTLAGVRTDETENENRTCCWCGCNIKVPKSRRQNGRQPHCRNCIKYEKLWESKQRRTA